MIRQPPPTPPLPDVLANKKERIKVDILLRSDMGFQERVRLKCTGDINDLQSIKDAFVYWAEHFCWALDEQTIGIKKRIPLVLYEFQKEMALFMIEEIWKAVHDPNYRWNGGADKARKMTATFTALLVLQFFAQFHGISSIVTSKSLDEVDIPGDFNTPFQRLKWQVEQQYELYPFLFPAAFKPNNKSHLKTALLNFQNGGQISGVAPNDKGMRQGRGLVWLGDEFAFVEGAYECWDASAGTVRVRLIFSTPNNPLVKFYQLINGKEGEQFHVFELDWWKHPDYAVGLYYKPDGTLSSPYFDGVCKTNTARVVAREYLRDHENSTGGRVFKMFRPEQSCVRGLQPDSRVRTIYRIWDPGLTFAVTWAQPDRYGRLLLLRELVLTTEDVTKGYTLLHMIAERALKITDDHYREFEIIDIGDPYGSRQQISAQAKEDTEYELLLKHYQIRVISAFMYKIAAHERKTKRIELLGDLMVKNVETEARTGDDLQHPVVTPGLLVDPETCPRTVEAFKGKYRRVVTETGEETDEIIKAHPYIDVVDCFGMGAIKVFYLPQRSSDKPTGTRRGRGKKWRPSGRRYA